MSGESRHKGRRLISSRYRHPTTERPAAVRAFFIGGAPTNPRYVGSPLAAFCHRGRQTERHSGNVRAPDRCTGPVTRRANLRDRERRIISAHDNLAGIARNARSRRHVSGVLLGIANHAFGGPVRRKAQRVVVTRTVPPHVAGGRASSQQGEKRNRRESHRGLPFGKGRSVAP